ncbi:response regulator, partial [bacterium]
MNNSLKGEQPRVLVVDDDRLYTEVVRDMLQKEGINAGVAFGGEEALELFEEGGWDVVVTDVVMDHMSGIDLLKEIKRRDSLVPVICISSVKSFDAVVEMLRGGAHNFIYKPLEPERLLSAVRKAHRDHLQAVENEAIIERSESWTKELLALRQLGESSSKDMLRILFRKTVEAVADTLQIETVSLMILEDEHLVVRDGIGLPEEVVGKARVPLGSGISGYVAQTGEPVLINDISKHDRFKPSKFRRQYSTQSALCVPLMRGERVLGVINANNKTSGASFIGSDLDLLVTIAAQVAMAVDNAGLYRGLEEKAEALAKAHEELLRLDKDKTELILNISHELKTPLTSIIGFAGLIHNLDLQDGDENEDLMMYVNRIESSANLLNHLVERMLELFRLEARRSKMTREFILSPEIVSLALADLEGVINGRNVERDIAAIEDKMIYCDPFLFTRAFGVILENAVKF